MDFRGSALTLLRPYRDSDHATVLGIFKSNTPDYFAPSEAHEFRSFLSAPNSEFVLVAMVGTDVVGFGAAYCRSAIEGGLAWGMVHRDWHGRGVGRALLEARIALLWSHEVEQVRVRTSQHSAGFFARAGFSVVEVEAEGFAPGIDQVTMLLARPRSAGRNATHSASGG